MIAKNLMPWLSAGRTSAWTPFTKVNCEGNVCRWTKSYRVLEKRKAPSLRGLKAFLVPVGAESL